MKESFENVLRIFSFRDVETTMEPYVTPPFWSLGAPDKCRGGFEPQSRSAASTQGQYNRPKVRKIALLLQLGSLATRKYLRGQNANEITF